MCSSGRDLQHVYIVYSYSKSMYQKNRLSLAQLTDELLPMANPYPWCWSDEDGSLARSDVDLGNGAWRAVAFTLRGSISELSPSYREVNISFNFR